MRYALQGLPNRQQQPIHFTLPAPLEGWDTETPVRELPPTRARVLDNYIPKGQSLAMRKGYAPHATGLGASVETLMPYNAGAASVMFAAAGSKIYNVTTAGAVGAAVVTALSGARFWHQNFSTPGGSFLYVVNGLDAPRYFNGTTWTVPTITGVTPADLIAVAESKQRLFFVVKNTMKFAYFPVETISGAIATYNLGSVFKRGGRLVAISTLTHDGGAGPEDYTVFLTSEGEVAVYRGSNPADALDWGLVGNWFVGEPIGDRPLVDLDGDVGVITRNGLVPVSQVFTGDAATNPMLYMTQRISSGFLSVSVPGAALNGWEAHTYPGGDIFFINAPVNATTAYQFVRHKNTGGWSRFTGLNAACWALFQGKLYFGGFDGNTYLADTAYQDNGGDIVGRLFTGWSSLGSRALKNMLLGRVVSSTETGASVAFVCRTDYDDTLPIPAAPASTLTNAGIWDVSLWDQCVWGGADLNTKQWRCVSGLGHSISVALESRSRQSLFALNAIDLTFNYGGAM